MEFGIKDKFELLLNGGIIEQRIADDLTYSELYESEDNLWSMLYMTGYVTKADHEISDEEQDITVRLRIPNKEITKIFEDTVVKWFNDNIDRTKQSELMDALWNKDDNTASEMLSDFLWKTIIYNDYHDDYYHAFLAGVFVGRGYSVDSNKEKGLGRPDILIKDRKNRRAIIIEAKKSDRESDMDKDCDKAIRQIIDGKYAEGIDDGYEKILCYGIAFFKKHARVKLLRE